MVALPVPAAAVAAPVPGSGAEPTTSAASEASAAAAAAPTRSTARPDLIALGTYNDSANGMVDIVLVEAAQAAPEPASLGLMLTALLGLGLVRRRRA